MFLASFPVPGGVRSISKGGSGREMVWAPSSNELYFRREDGHLLAVTIGPDGTPGSLRPVNTGDLPFSSCGPGAANYDVFPDGRILALKTVSDAAADSAGGGRCELVERSGEEVEISAPVALVVVIASLPSTSSSWRSRVHPNLYHLNPVTFEAPFKAV